MIPEWVIILIKHWKNHRKTGSIILNFSDGGIRNYTIQQTENPPKALCSESFCK